MQISGERRPWLRYHISTSLRCDRLHSAPWFYMPLTKIISNQTMTCPGLWGTSQSQICQKWKSVHIRIEKNAVFVLSIQFKPPTQEISCIPQISEMPFWVLSWQVMFSVLLCYFCYLIHDILNFISKHPWKANMCWLSSKVGDSKNGLNQKKTHPDLLWLFCFLLPSWLWVPWQSSSVFPTASAVPDTCWAQQMNCENK